MADTLQQILSSQSSAVSCQHMILPRGCSRVNMAALSGRTSQAGPRAGTCLHLCHLGVSTTCMHQSQSSYSLAHSRLLPPLTLKMQRRWQHWKRKADCLHRPSLPQAKHPTQVVLRPLFQVILYSSLAALSEVAGLTESRQMPRELLPRGDLLCP